jgi:hypothetical protein
MSLQTLGDADRELLDDSPTLARLVRKGRLAPSRLAQLLAAGRTTTPPKEPEPWECCGSNCRPCVLELWKVRLLSSSCGRRRADPGLGASRRRSGCGTSAIPTASATTTASRRI